MSFSIGIVGLPNVGKSTLFNALTNIGVEAANYPFATIEPNVGIVPVPDKRLTALAELEQSAETIPTIIEFKDIAGLVAGAHKGEGLGNKFLSHIREVDAIVEIVRFFDDKNITHVSGHLDPKRDIDTIHTELVLADLEMIEKKRENLQKAAKNGNKDDIKKLALVEKFYETLANGSSASEVLLSDEDKKLIHEFPLLTLKPILYVANIETGNTPNIVEGIPIIPIDIKLEAELAELGQEEKASYLKDLGLAASGLDRLITESYKLLDLITFFTAGPKETRAWTCTKGRRAPQAAGIIHTDFEKGFIRAEVINWKDLLDFGGWNKAKEQGKIRTEGKEYMVQDGDVVHFRHAQ